MCSLPSFSCPASILYRVVSCSSSSSLPVSQERNIWILWRPKWLKSRRSRSTQVNRSGGSTSGRCAKAAPACCCESAVLLLYRSCASDSLSISFHSYLAFSEYLKRLEVHHTIGDGIGLVFAILPLCRSTSGRDVTQTIPPHILKMCKVSAILRVPKSTTSHI